MTRFGGIIFGFACLVGGATAFIQPLATRSSALKSTNVRPLALKPATPLLNRDRSIVVVKDAAGEETVSAEVPFELRGFSLATVALGLGSLITVGSLAEYLISSGSEGLSGVGFVYGIPILLIGLSLQYAQLNPVPVESTSEADRVFEQKATPTIMKIKKDVTRHRYGDDAHLDTTVQALGLVMPNKEFPQLKSLKQGVMNGELTFSMIFQSEDTPYRLWVEPERIAKYEKFFGPGVWAQIEKVDAAQRLVAIKLITGTRPDSSPVAAAAEAEDKEAAVASADA